jgi:hypothetical protein
MFLGLFFGLIIGLGLIIYLFINYSSNNQIILDLDYEDIEDEKTLNKAFILDLPVEKKLRNAIFECENNEMKCREEIQKIIDLQLDLLEGICKISHIHIKEKAAYFIIGDPVKNVNKYFYNSDLNLNIDSNILTETQNLLLRYKEQIEFLYSKIIFFQKLIETHQNNLNRIHGIHKQNEQLAKIKRHKGKIDDYELDTQFEVNALKNETVLEEIGRELEFQEEFLKEYNQLNKEYEQENHFKFDKTYQDRISKILENRDKKA